MLIAIKDIDRVTFYFTRDKVGFIGVTENDLLNTENLPIWKPKGLENVLMSLTINYRVRDLVRYDDPLDFPITLKNLQTIYAPKLRKLLLDHHLFVEGGTLPFVYVVFATQEQIFTVNFNFYVEEHKDYLISSEFRELLDYSLSLSANQNLPSKERVKQALELYEKYSSRKYHNIYVMDNKDFKVTKF